MTNQPITLTGVITQDIQQRKNAKGDYYFTFLRVRDRKHNIPLLLYYPDYWLVMRATTDLIAGRMINCWGFWSRDQKFFFLRDWNLEVKSDGSEVELTHF